MVTLRNGRFYVITVVKNKEYFLGHFNNLSDALTFEANHLSRLNSDIIDIFKEIDKKNSERFKPDDKKTR